MILKDLTTGRDLRVPTILARARNGRHFPSRHLSWFGDFSRDTIRPVRRHGALVFDTGDSAVSHRDCCNSGLAGASTDRQ